MIGLIRLSFGFSAHAYDALVRVVPALALCAFADDTIQRQAVLAARIRGKQRQVCLSTARA
jgi:hypothetical protein